MDELVFSEHYPEDGHGLSSLGHPTTGRRRSQTSTASITRTPQERHLSSSRVACLCVLQSASYSTHNCPQLSSRPLVSTPSQFVRDRDKGLIRKYLTGTVLHSFGSKGFSLGVLC
ncbi:hypothetical protein ElyMa_004874500 [Elysia marginata]|uniref:Uncharacterized protein n=1 Tax=Elysia marginata TaxID=1093978 RepID=A0AAV4ITS1_9GAST|nr:hypothetical protein ElyMa_004874500 [Elysia marginata]